MTCRIAQHLADAGDLDLEVVFLDHRAWPDFGHDFILARDQSSPAHQRQQQVEGACAKLCRRAVYGKNSFRGVELGFRNRHFEATQHGYRVSDAVRDPVRFQLGNLLAGDFLPEAEIYDMISFAATS